MKAPKIKEAWELTKQLVNCTKGKLNIKQILVVLQGNERFINKDNTEILLSIVHITPSFFCDPENKDLIDITHTALEHYLNELPGVSLQLKGELFQQLYSKKVCDFA